MEEERNIAVSHGKHRRREPPWALGQRPSLDGLRAIAIIGVLGIHVGARLAPQYQWFPGGWTGVEVFFVLSGFLITSLLIEENDRSRISLHGFYRRRIFRLWPALWLFVAADMLYNAWVHWLTPRSWEAAGLTLAWGGNFALERGMDMYNLSHLWTLGIEEQFYLLWPLALIFLLSRHRLAVPIGISAVCLGWFLYIHSTTNLATMSIPEPAVVGLLMGSLLGWAMHRGFSNGRWSRVLAFPAIAYLLAVYFVIPSTGAWFQGTGIYLLEIATVVLLLACLDSGFFVKVFGWAPVRWIGRISYSLYLWHYLVLGVVITLWPHDQGLGLAMVGIVASFVVASISYYCVERPFVRYGHRQSGRADNARTSEIEPTAHVSPALSVAEPNFESSTENAPSRPTGIL